MVSISSASNPSYKSLKKLLGSTQIQRKRQLACVDSHHPLMEVLHHHPSRIQTILVNKSINESKWKELFEGLNCPIYALSHGLFSELFYPQHPTGVAAVMDIRDLSPKYDPNDHHRMIIIDGVQHALNMGAIIRNAAAFECDGIWITPHSVYPFHTQSIRASVGTVFKLPIWELHSAAMSQLIRSDVSFYAANPHASLGLTDITVDQPSAWIFGSEEHGIQSEHFDSDQVALTEVSIPIHQKVESLNTAVSSGIILFYVNNMIK